MQMENKGKRGFKNGTNVGILFFLCCIILTLFVLFFQDVINWSYQANKLAHLIKMGINPDDISDWKVKNTSFDTSIGNTITIREIEHRSKLNNDMYGIEKVDALASKKLGFVRRLRRYKRKKVVSVLERPENRIQCDSWMKNKALFNDEKHSFSLNSLLQSCAVEEGDTACFNCVESRQFSRSCIHVEKDLTLTKKDGSTLVIPKNSSEKSGWCLPSNFKHSIFNDEQVVPRDSKRQCNSNTGTWLLSQLSDGDDDGNVSYNWICKCRYPNLMSNLTTVESDCLLPVGCGENGRLDDRTAQGLVDPYREGSCICNYGYTPNWDKIVGPTCSQLGIGETDILENIYNKYKIKFGQSLRHDFISPVFLSLFDNQYSGQTAVPDPCKVDALTGLETDGCEAVRWIINNQWIVFCQSITANHVAIKTSTDYLLNNYGRYPNACAKVYESDDQSMITKAMNIPMNLSFLNGKSQPDVGIIILAQLPSNLRRLYTLLWHSDPNLRAWYEREVKPTKIWNNKRFELLYNLNSIGDNNTIVVYEDHPNAREAQQTYLHKLLYEPFSINSQESLQYEKTFILYGQHYNRYFREYHGFKDYWWWDQYLDQYNESGDWGRVPNGAMYTKYIAQSNDVNKQIYRMTITHHRFSEDEIANEKHAQYPAIPKRCYWCGDTGSLNSDEVRQNIIPSLYVCFYKNQFLPIQINKKYFSFDATVTIFKTTKKPQDDENKKFEVFIFAERFVGNFRGYHQRALKL